MEREGKAVLIGEYQHTIDTKGRLIMPARFRDDLGNHFIITKGLDNCLFVYSLTEWAVLEERIRALPLSQARDLQRFFFSGAAEAEVDRQGRILIPAHLREYAAITKDIVINGALVRAEIWNKEKWQNQNSALTSDRIAEAMEKIGF